MFEGDKKLTGMYNFERRKPRRGARKKVHGGGLADIRVTEDGETRLTEDDETRVIE